MDHKQKSLNLNSPIVLVSGSLDLGIIKEVRYQVQGVVVKPFRYEQLLTKIHEARYLKRNTLLKVHRVPNAKHSQ